MKSIFLFITSILFFLSPTFSQTDPALKYAESITEKGLKEQLTIVASAEMEGRETGTEGQRKAAAYIESQFKKTGLLSPPNINDFRQYYPLNKDTLIPKKLKIGKKSYRFGIDYIITPGTESDKEYKSKKIIFAGYGITDKNYDDYAGRDVKNKIVAIFSGEPKNELGYIITGNDTPSSWGKSLNKKAILAMQKGAVALLLIDPNNEALSGPAISNSKNSTINYPGEKNSNKEKVPVVSVSHAIVENIFGNKISSEIIDAAKAGKSLKKIIIEKEIITRLAFRKKTIVTNASNVIGFIEGTDKKSEYVFITAHYDHLGKKGPVIFYGADDDGSGTVSVIEMAKAFAKAKEDGFGTSRSIVFMTVSGEEKGLWGSDYYSDHPVFPLDSTSIDLNTDMVGRVDPGRNYGDSMNYVYVIGDDKLSSELKAISTLVNKKYEHLELDEKFNSPDDPLRIYYRSDHYNFAKKGVPILFYFDGIHKDYHKPTDTVDKINFDLMEKRVRLIFLTAWEMANRQNMLKRDLGIPKEEKLIR
jgi:hypothetical protein